MHITNIKICILVIYTLPLCGINFKKMVLKADIEQSITEQLENLELRTDNQSRFILPNLTFSTSHILVITGIRRCGKSTLMQQMMATTNSKFGYFHFEDPRIFGFEVGDFPKLEDALGEVEYYFFDEIQNIENWELFIRNLHNKTKNICITGSNASLLSKELGTRLTGRNIQIELFPFSYTEFCRFKNLENNKVSFQNYLALGGFSDYVRQPRTEYLQQLFKDLLYRDIIVRYGIRQGHVVEALALYLISNVGKEYTLNNLRKMLNVGAVNSIADYLAWFEDSYMLFSIQKFSHSLRSMAVNAKKIYTIDTGFAQANSLSFSEDKGRLLENAVFIHLKRQQKTIFYFKEKGECDFVIKERNQVTAVLQVCYDLTSDNLARELNGLKEAMDFFGLKVGTIVTMNQTDEFSEKGITIKVVPANVWFAEYEK
jgi:uncharacterized protein